MNAISTAAFLLNPELSDTFSKELDEFIKYKECFGDIHPIHKDGVLNLRQAIELAEFNGYEYFTLFGAGHKFTDNFSVANFNYGLNACRKLRAKIVVGGVSYIGANSLYLNSKLFWADSFSPSAFIVIFKGLYGALKTLDLADKENVFAKICSLTSNKFTFYPFICYNDDEKYQKESVPTTIRLLRLKEMYDEMNVFH